MNKFAVIIPYFGKFKPSITLFLESCNRNPDVDWLFFTDCQVPSGMSIKQNIRWSMTTLSELHVLAEEKLKKHVTLTRPYKLCDLKPFYGVIFSDYLSGYEYWGYGDTDVIYGQLTAYLSKIHYADYDKINWMGHLCFLRNNKKCNYSPFFTLENTADAEFVLQNEANLGFDERDFNKKCLAQNLKIYTGQWAADIDIFYQRMRCVDRFTLHQLLDTTDVQYAPKNYAKQLFAVINGKIYRVYLRLGKVYWEEFAYIHFRKEAPLQFFSFSQDTYIISRDGFWPLEYEPDELHTYDIAQKLIKRLNSQQNTIQETTTSIYQWYRKISGKRGW